MYLLNILIESVPMEYDGLISCEEKQNYQENVAWELVKKHRPKILMVGKMPVFYVDGVESKMNNKNSDHEP